ncbi:MAG: tyrosine--tRNA ligase [bacterium]
MALSMKSSKKLSKEEQIDEILSRSVAEILPSKTELKKLLLSRKKLRIYIGTDPTGTSLHLGHATNYIILERFRKLGHEIIFLIGDFTARIGDPTDKEAARTQLSREEVKKNVKTWLKQISSVIDLYNKKNPVKIMYNHDWLSKFTFEDVIKLASNFTVQQMLERDMFEKRMKEEKPIYLHEFFYPLMQGYDSVHLEVDIEMCGNDQRFNALVGRTLLRKLKEKEKFVFITTLLENPITKEKMMSKSLGTGVFLDESADNMYGKLMAQADENIPQLFTDCTYVPMNEIKEIKKRLTKKHVNPRDIKMCLAREIVTIYYGEKAAKKAEDEFKKVFQRKETPTDMKELFIPSVGMVIIDILVNGGITDSKSKARRLIEQGGVRIEDVIVEDAHAILELEEGTFVTLQSGKRNFLKVIRE